MSGKLYFAKIDVKKIDKDRLFKGDKGTYLDLTIWIGDEDKFGNTMSIQQSTKKDEDKIYLGNGKEYQPKEQSSTPAPDGPEDLPW